MDYIYLRAWDRMMGSSSYWCIENIARAKKDNAPQDAIYKNGDHWQTVDDIVAIETKEILCIIVERWKE